MQHFIYIATLSLICQLASAQKIERIHLKRANKLKGGIFNGQKINKVLGNVVFKHKNATMYCDSAYQYVSSNKIDAFGHIKIKDKSSTIYGDVLHYNGDTELAQIRGNEVKLVDKKQTLTTQFLDYNLKTNTGVYFNGGKVIDQESTLTSEKGTYYNNSKKYTFKDSVKLVREDYVLTSDTLEYHSASKIAFFHGPTHINSPSQHLFAKSGQYHTTKDISNFSDSAFIETDKFHMTGDSIFFDNKKDLGEAYGNVRLFSKEDSLTVFGNKAKRWGKLAYAEVYENVLALKLLGQDTMFLKADTLCSQQDTLGKKGAFRAYQNVKIYNKDFQGKCDSLEFLTADSIIYFFNSPILWSTKHQIKGDTVIAYLNDGTISLAKAIKNSFITSQDTLGRFNQIKGKNMVANFKNGDIDNIDVNGNGESIYYAKDDKKDDALIGLNYIICSNMMIYFRDNELNRISFLKKPEAKFIPPTEIKKSDKSLKGFSWDENKRPYLGYFKPTIGEKKIIDNTTKKE